MRRLPARWGRFQGIEGLPLFIVATHGIVYLYELISPGLMSLLVLSPSAVYAGDVWRLFTFLFVPPPLHPIFMIFWLYLLYIFATALESEWGSFRFTVFYAVGFIATSSVGLLPVWGIVHNVYLNTSLFLAFATLFPEFELLLFFFLPVKVKYLGYLAWAWFAVSLLFGGLFVRLMVVAALLGYLIVLGPDIWETIQLRWQVHQNRKRWPKD